MNNIIYGKMKITITEDAVNIKELLESIDVSGHKLWARNITDDALFFYFVLNYIDKQITWPMTRSTYDII